MYKSREYRVDSTHPSGVDAFKRLSGMAYCAMNADIPPRSGSRGNALNRRMCKFREKDMICSAVEPCPEPQYCAAKQAHARSLQPIAVKENGAIIVERSRRDYGARALENNFEEHLLSTTTAL